jgi:Flp pilus assembly secretin CpaC
LLALADFSTSIFAGTLDLAGAAACRPLWQPNLTALSGETANFLAGEFPIPM